MGVTEWQRHSRRVTRGPRWKTLRMAVLERDGFKCRFCGQNRGRLEIDYFSSDDLDRLIGLLTP